MRLTNVQKRVGRLENALADLSSSRERKGHHELPTLIHQLLNMAMEASRIEKRALARGDDVNALTAIREVCRIAELIARLRGEFDETRAMDIHEVEIDPETAKRITEIYDKRHTTKE